MAQNRAQNRYLWFDKQIVPETVFETLSERLWEPLLSVATAANAYPQARMRPRESWEPLLSVATAANPRRGLLNLRLLAQDEAGVDRATVAGIYTYRTAHGAIVSYMMMSCYTCQAAGISDGGMGTTANSRLAPSGLSATTVTVGALRPWL